MMLSVGCSPVSQLKVKRPDRFQPKPVVVGRCCACFKDSCNCADRVNCVYGKSLDNMVENWVNMDAYTTELEALGCFK